MDIGIAIQAAGGLALFLLAMQMMTEGLKAFAGSGLRHMLGQWTRTPIRGVGSGILVTGIVQSSSAVTIATIGFVNAGMLGLQQALGVIFGANVGTTVTSWLVSLVGAGFKIDALALPILTVGIILKLTGSRRRVSALGEALAGFGLFFLGLVLLKDAFSGIAASYGESIGGPASYPWIAYIAVGFIATMLTQSSSATLAIVLTAAAGGVLSLEAGAAAVIGASLGTTSTAAVAVIKATPAAKRLAIGHILFNVIAGVAALLLMPLMLWAVAAVADVLDMEGNPAILLAIFHTLFKLTGLALTLPFTARIAHVLEKLFRSEEEDNARPRHLDRTLTATPELAVAALGQEMQRLQRLVNGLLRATLTREGMTHGLIERQRESVNQLFQAVMDFTAQVRTEKMSVELVEQLTAVVRTGRYLDEAAGQARHLLQLREQKSLLSDPHSKDLLEVYLEQSVALLSDADASPDLRLALEATYQQLKAAVLDLLVRRKVSAEAADQLLDALSGSRRMMDQWCKASSLRSRVWPELERALDQAA